MSGTDRLAEAVHDVICTVHDVICTALADYDSHEPGDIRYLCDPAPFRASLERLEIQPAAPADFGEQVLISNAAGERIVREGLAKRQPAAPAEGLKPTLPPPDPRLVGTEYRPLFPAAPAEGLRERIAAFFRAYDATHLVHDVAYEGVNDAAAALRAALTPEDDR